MNVRCCSPAPVTAKKLAKQLTAAGIPAVELHGDLSQSARERNLEAFTNGSTRVLVATDIAARGIHVDEVALVVHVDPPAEHKAYLHQPPAAPPVPVRRGSPSR
ncbi:MAG: C-terminal helicase domain-containing protein [Ilumatobacteraceae bacterium]